MRRESAVMQNKPSWMLDGDGLQARSICNAPFYSFRVGQRTGEVLKGKRKKNHRASEFGFYTFSTTTLAIGRYSETQPFRFVTRQRVCVCVVPPSSFFPCYLKSFDTTYAK